MIQVRSFGDSKIGRGLAMSAFGRSSSRRNAATEPI